MPRVIVERRVRQRHCDSKELLPVQSHCALNLLMVVVTYEQVLDPTIRLICGMCAFLMIRRIATQILFECLVLLAPRLRSPESDTCEPAIRLQNAAKLCHRAFDVEPVKGPSSRNHLNRRIHKSRSLSRPVSDLKPRCALMETDAHLSHLRIRFHRNDPVAICQKDITEHARTGSHIRNGPLRCQSTPLPQPRQQKLWRISLPISRVLSSPPIEAVYALLH